MPLQYYVFKFFGNKTNFMNVFVVIGIFYVISAIWIGYEMWKAPLAEETKDGGFRIIKPGRKLSDLFKKRK